MSEAFSEDDYRRTVDLLEHFYNIVLTDCGTGLMHSAMYGVLAWRTCSIVSSGSIDGARSASATMDWLDAHGHGDLVRNSVAVINACGRGPAGWTWTRWPSTSRRCRAVVQVPFDAHLEEGAEISLDRLEPQTRLALLELAAVVASGFSDVRRDPAGWSWAPLLPRVVPVAEPTQEIGIVVGTDHAGLRAARGHSHEPPADIGQPGQYEKQEQKCHEKPPLSEYTRRR